MISATKLARYYGLCKNTMRKYGFENYLFVHNALTSDLDIRDKKILVYSAALNEDIIDKMWEFHYKKIRVNSVEKIANEVEGI